jgi:hypothetical protein
MQTPFKIETIKRLLESHAEKLSGRFVVVSEKTIRFAHVQ